ncbi:hypothetical protein LJB81_04385 [Desulfovibrio sp. OttesenSCG-928-M14]|nr:hypothetical protein [Desulfovibrio sp. OttesenSCG-928-M14]
MADKAQWAIRRFCLECQGGDAQAVADCVDSRCFLYPFRLNRADIASPPHPGRTGQSRQALLYGLRRQQAGCTRL